MANYGVGNAVSDAITLYSAYSAQEGQENTNEANRDFAREQMQFQKEMSNTAHQREVADLIKAGLNPMLSTRLGGASTPQGATATSQNPQAAAATAGAQSAGSQAALAGLELTKAQTAKTQAETTRTAAEEKEILAKTETYAPSIQVMTQHVKESENRIENIIQMVKTGKATETNLGQQTTNMKETISQIRETVNQLKSLQRLQGAHTTLAGAQTIHSAAQAKLAGAQTGEITQRVAANLPALEAALGNLERVARDMDMPRRQNESNLADSGTGAILNAAERVLKSLNPFSGIIANVPNTPPTPGPGRKDWKK